jgi:class 3 adenylate cyclase/tetratricopeptide (TPR) repeat protein
MRKTVTVLFCDVTGSTALGESLDPEPLRALLARYFEEMKEIVERHGGTVEKFIGDAVMAVFGVPAVHEDDALRALRAAVEMRDAFPGLGIEGRIGVSTGEVVTGTEERLATGDAVNVAARLEQAARPGEVLVSEATFRLARDAAEVEPVEPLALKGKSAPLPAFRLISVRAGAPAFTRRLDSPMVGREREGGLLRQAFERSRDERACHLFTILGPAGIGKSRLVAELLKGIGAEATVVSGRCLPYGEGITYWPLLEILEALGRELELGSPEETAWAARKLLEEAAGRRPLVVVLDDIHWAEPTFLDLVEHVADLSRDAPILLVCVARPELLDTRPGWGGGKLNATTILLEPLGEDEVGRLVANLLDEAPLPPGVLERVEAAAEGNPLFVEEMLAMLAEDGADVEIEIPPTIQALLAARLDRLDSEERDVLGRASVEGKVFHAGGVATLAPQELRPSVRGYLTGLVRKELIRPDRPSIEGEDAFRFRHLLIRDAAYQSLPKEERANLHERFVGWLESLGENVLGLGEIAGYHLEQAHGYLVELGQAERAKPLAARAASRLSAAGIAASRRGDLPSAVNLLGRAEALLPRDGPERLGLLPELGKVLGTMGRLVEADAVLTEAIDRAEAVGPRDVLLSATIARIALRMNSAPADRVAETRAEIERLLPELKRAGDDRTLAHALQAIAMTHQMLCNYDDFHAVAIDQLEHAPVPAIPCSWTTPWLRSRSRSSTAPRPSRMRSSSFGACLLLAALPARPIARSRWPACTQWQGVRRPRSSTGPVGSAFASSDSRSAGPPIRWRGDGWRCGEASRRGRSPPCAKAATP